MTNFSVLYFVAELSVYFIEKYVLIFSTPVLTQIASVITVNKVYSRSFTCIEHSYYYELNKLTLVSSLKKYFCTLYN